MISKRRLIHITAVRIRKGERLAEGYLNTNKWRDASVAEADGWEFSASMVLDDPEDLGFFDSDCALWGIEADRRLAAEPQDPYDTTVHMCAVYDIHRTEAGDDAGVEFVGWANWAKVIDFAGATATPGGAT